MADPAHWLVLSVEAPSEDARPALTEGLLALGGSSVQEDGTLLTTYISAPADADAFLAAARARLEDIDARIGKLTWRMQADEDWSESWKRGLRPRRVGKHFIVTPSWAQPERRAGDRVIVIDPEMAFGTGEHGTTRGALRFLEQAVKPGARVLDVGTGSAILAIGAALLGASEVLALDNDADAILNARDNVARNGVADAVQLEVGLVDARFLDGQGGAAFDVIAANVLSGVLRPLLPGFLQAVRPGGHVILGGILEQEADDMMAAATGCGFVIAGEDLEDEWWGALLRRP